MEGVVLYEKIQKVEPENHEAAIDYYQSDVDRLHNLMSAANEGITGEHFEMLYRAEALAEFENYYIECDYIDALYCF